MSKVKNISVIPIEIQAYYSELLLNKPLKLHEDSENLWNVFLYIEEKLLPRIKNLPGKTKKYEKLRKEFIEKYERTKIKEEERKTEKGHSTQMPMYFFNEPDCHYGWVYEGLRYRYGLDL